MSIPLSKTTDYKRAYQEKLYQKHGGKTRFLRMTNVKAKYGISIEQYETMLKVQGGGCAICGEQCKTGKALAVDHCHKTGVVRGLLCGRCNKGLGLFGDRPGLLRKAADYLNGA
jgi:hypothetical protein